MKDTIAIYLRTSLEDYGKAHQLLDQSFSITNQRKLIQGYLAQHEDLGRLEAVEYVDDGFTGTNTNRPRFQTMLRDVEHGQIGAVVVKDLSRLGRSYLEVGEYLERVFPLAGIRVVAINDGYDSANFIGVTGGIDVAFRNFIYDSYSKDLSTKVRSAMRVRMEKGKFISHPPYGYMKSPDDKHRMIPDPETAPIVREIFRMVLDGRTTSQVAAGLNDRGVPTPLQYKQHKLKAACQNRELLWTHITVVNILHNYKYTGAMVNHVRESRQMRDRNQRRTAPEEWIVTEGAHEALISKEHFERANAMLRHPKKTRRNPSGRNDSVYYCGHCGRKLRRTSSTETCFVCDTPAYRTDTPCQGLRWRKRDLEKVLLPIYRVQLDLLGQKAVELQRGSQGTDAAAFVRRMGQLEREISGCKRRKLELFEAYHDRAMDMADYTKRKAALHERMIQLQAEQKETETAYQQAKEERERRNREADQIASYLSGDGDSDEAVVWNMYEAIDRVSVIDRHHLEVRWRFADLFANSPENALNAAQK